MDNLRFVDIPTTSACRMFFKLTRIEVSMIDLSKLVPNEPEFAVKVCTSRSAPKRERQAEVIRVFIIKDTGNLNLSLHAD